MRDTQRSGAYPGPMDKPDLSLGARDGLPDALRALLYGPGRNLWRTHPEFGPLTQFWLERHLAFRGLLAQMQSELQARLDGILDPQDYAAQLSNLGGRFLTELHGHHSIEDSVYFPRMAALAPEVSPAFDLLDADHHQLHGALDGFASAANGLLRGTGGAAELERQLATLDLFLDRHLIDEEEVIVPVILKLGERSFT